MGPLLGYWIADGLVQADEQLTDLFRVHLEHGRRRAAKLGSALARVVQACRQLEITPTVLKGTHTGRGFFPEPGTRPCADIDLLVRPEEFERACDALRSAGFTEVRRTRTPPRSEWVERGEPQRLESLELDHADNPWSIDLHRSLDRWYFRGLRAGFQPAQWATVDLILDGTPTRGLAQPLLTAFLAMHAGFGIRDVRLLQIVELVLCIRRDTGTGALTWNQLGGLLSATGTGRFALPGLALAENLAPGTVERGFLHTLEAQATPRMRRVIDAVARAGMRLPRRTLDERFMWSCGPKEVLYNIGEALWPSDEALPAAEVARLYLRRLRMMMRGQVGIRSRPGDAT